MSSDTARSARQLLDAVNTVAQLDGFAAEPFVDQLRDELRPPVTLDGLAALDDALRGELAAVDAFTGKAMRIRLDHVLAGDRSLGTPFRKVITTTIVGYAEDLELLRTRVASTAARPDPQGAATTADAVVGVAREVLDLRARLRDGVLVLARELATAVLPEARRAARDRTTDDALRLRWSAARRELETIVEHPERITEAPLATRLAALPPIMDEPDETTSPTFGELLELD